MCSFMCIANIFWEGDMKIAILRKFCKYFTCLVVHMSITKISNENSFKAF